MPSISCNSKLKVREYLQLGLPPATMLPFSQCWKADNVVLVPMAKRSRTTRRTRQCMIARVLAESFLRHLDPDSHSSKEAGKDPYIVLLLAQGQVAQTYLSSRMGSAVGLCFQRAHYPSAEPIRADSSGRGTWLPGWAPQKRLCSRPCFTTGRQWQRLERLRRERLRESLTGSVEAPWSHTLMHSCPGI